MGDGCESMEELRRLSYPLYFSDRLSSERQAFIGVLDASWFADRETLEIRMEELYRLSGEAFISARSSGEFGIYTRSESDRWKRLRKRDRELHWRRPDPHLVDCLELLDLDICDCYARGMILSPDPEMREENRKRFMANKLQLHETLERIRRRVEHLEKINHRRFAHMRKLVAVWDANFRIAEAFVAYDGSGESPSGENHADHV